MVDRLRSRSLNLSQSLGFIPGVIVVAFAIMGIGLVEIDRHTELDGRFLFSGDGPAARTVLSVIAGSLITVAGLTFSITMVVLQLASSQFSPRILRTFFGDRVTQITIGTYVGTFVYAILVLRAVGSLGGTGFVPRLSITVASLLGIGAVALLIVFLNHVSRMVQVSHVTGRIARDTLARLEILFPDPYGEPVDDESASALLAAWRSQPSGQARSERPGYVQRVAIDEIVQSVGRHSEKVAILVCPGDFVTPDMPIVETWPAAAAEDCRKPLLASVPVAGERDLDQDVDFGLRQLADTALKAVSPGINDPATAVTCVGYLRAILVRLTERSAAPCVRRFPDQELVVIVRERRFDEYLESMLQINRYVAGDAWVIGEMLQALDACAQAAERSRAGDRLRAIHAVTATIATQAAEQLGNDRDRERIRALMAAMDERATSWTQ